MSTKGRPTDIEFPCEGYPIKVIGDAADGFLEQVLERLDALNIRYDEAAIRQADSRAGRFLSFTIPITAESEAQLSDLNTRLRELDFVRMVL